MKKLSTAQERLMKRFIADYTRTEAQDGTPRAEIMCEEVRTEAALIKKGLLQKCDNSRSCYVQPTELALEMFADCVYQAPVEEEVVEVNQEPQSISDYVAFKVYPKEAVESGVVSQQVVVNEVEEDEEVEFDADFVEQQIKNAEAVAELKEEAVHVQASEEHFTAVDNAIESEEEEVSPNSSLMIGFTEKFFTLWSCRSEEVWKQFNGQNYLAEIKHINTYIQNLSMNEAEAIKKAKSFGCVNLEVNEWLKGEKGSFTRSEKFERPSYNDDQFSFGRYEGQSITDCTDSSYLYWYANETDSKIAAERLCELDSKYIMVEGELTTKKEQLLQSIKSDESIVWIATSNFKNDSVEYGGFTSLNAIFEPRTEEEVELLNDNPYGIQLFVNAESLNLVQKWYQGHDYYVPKGMRSFKKQKFTIQNEAIQMASA